MRVSPLTLGLLLPLIVVSPLRAWGPHSEITMAGVATLPADDDLRKELGPEIEKLREHCWMGDMRRSLHRDAQEWFYADDYLLFPAMTMHRDHLCPEVKQTYDPYFRRALQALRTETPRNAARWIGAILHFTEDTGSPPHAAEIRGDVHSKMENWVDAKAITLGDYRPQLLGSTEDEAVAGFLRRMDGLIEFSKQRAERAKPFVIAGDRPSTEPIVLESALETSRVVADLLHTLGKLASAAQQGTAALSGQTGVGTGDFAKLPTKVVVLGTLFSTVADPSGHYSLRQLPAGEYEVVASRPGATSAPQRVTLTPGATANADFALSGEKANGNLIRNGTFSLEWLGAHRPDAWYPVRSRIDAPHWEGEMLPVKAGGNYRLQVDWQSGVSGQVMVRIYGPAGFSKPATDSKPLTAGQPALDFSASENGFAQVLVYSDGSPAAVARRVSLIPQS